jgi:negative regulator of sigma E activity
MKQSPHRQSPLPLPKQYAAEIVRSDGEQARIYEDGVKSRAESFINGRTSIVIKRPDLKLLYDIELEPGTYSTIPLTPEIEQIGASDVEEGFEWEFVGSDTLNSRAVDIYDVYIRGDESRLSRIYLDRENHIRWKQVTFNRFGKEVLIIETRNVTIGPPAASVFELPTGLKKI